MSLNLSSITAGIAALSISGVTVKDVSGTPATITVRDTPILFPDLNQMVTSGTPGVLTFGAPGGRYWEVTRTLKYVYLHCVAGATRAPSDILADMGAKQDAIIEAVAELDVSNVDVTTVNCGMFGTLGDPAESQKFYGFTLDIGMKEKVNA